MAMLGINITGPEWEKLTGIKLQRDRDPVRGALPKQMLEHKAGSGAYDVMTDRAVLGRRHGAQRRARAARSLYREVRRQERVRRHHSGLQGLDDLRRQDLRASSSMATCTSSTIARTSSKIRRTRRRSRRSTATTSARPQTWKAFGEICQFITDKYAPEMYGAGLINTGYMHFFFSERFRTYGGKFFDPETMKATVNSQAGIDALTDMVDQIKCQPPGVADLGLRRKPQRAQCRRDRDDHHLAAARRAGRRASTPTSRRSPGCRRARWSTRSAMRCRRAAIPSSPPASCWRLARQQEQGCRLPLHPVAPLASRRA